MVLVPLAPRWKNSMPSNQIEADGLVCWVLFKGFILACHNMNHGQGVYHTHSIVASVTIRHNSSHWLHTLILCHRLSVFLTIALFGLIEEYETPRSDIFSLSPTDMPIYFTAGDLTSQTASVERHHSSTGLLPPIPTLFFLPLFFPTSPSPSPSLLFPTFSIPSPSQFASICRALPLKIEKGSWPATTNLKRRGEEKIPFF